MYQMGKAGLYSETELQVQVKAFISETIQELVNVMYDYI